MASVRTVEDIDREIEQLKQKIDHDDEELKNDKVPLKQRLQLLLPVRETLNHLLLQHQRMLPCALLRLDL